MQQLIIRIALAILMLYYAYQEIQSPWTIAILALVLIGNEALLVLMQRLGKMTRQIDEHMTEILELQNSIIADMNRK